MDHADITLAVLAGGKGSRMGMAKSALQIAGSPILQYILQRLSWPGATLLVTGLGNEKPAGSELFDAELTDAVADQGPLRGILTALEGAKTSVVAVVTVDMPGLEREQIDWLAERLGEGKMAMISRIIDGVQRVEPFPCVLRSSARGMIAQRIEAGRRSVHSLAEEPGVSVFAAPQIWPQRVWTNLNHPEDLRSFEAS